MAHKILHLVTTLGPGGIERWLLDMLRTISRDQCAIDFCCRGATTGLMASQAEALGARVWHNPLHWTHIGYGLRLREILQSEGYNLVHNHLTVCAGLPVLVARLAGVPSILSFHNTTFQTRELGLVHRHLRGLYAWLNISVASRMSQAITGCSQGVLHALEQRYNIADPVPRHVLYYGVCIPQAPDTILRSRLRRELSLAKHTQIVVHVGRFVPQKNHAGLLRIAQQVIQASPSTCFVLIGDGPLRREIEVQVERLGLTLSFRFLGIRDDVERILTCCDLLLCPSVWEGFGLVAIEANAAGIPVVASDVPGLREAVEQGETGFLCHPGDESVFAETVCRLLGDINLRRRLGQNGIRRVRNRFSKERSARELCQLYDWCLDRV